MSGDRRTVLDMTDGNRILLATLAGLLLFAGTFGIAVFVINSSNAAKEALSDAYDDCASFTETVTGGEARGFARLMDDGESIQVESPAVGQEMDIAATMTRCILDETDAPDVLATKIATTSALTGRQVEEYGDFKVTYSYSSGESGGFLAIFEVVR